MKKIILNTVLLLLSLSINAQHTNVTKLRKNWKFINKNVENAQSINFDDANWKSVNIPHDWAIEQPFIVDGNGVTGKLPWKGEGWYRTTFKTPNKNKQYYLVFDGVMAFPKVYINGKLAGEWDYGYNSFYLNITNFVNAKENTLAVHANTTKHDSRWYPGAGIYRKVQLVEVNPIHTDIWGTHITTPIVKDAVATIQIATSINNSLNKKSKIELKQTIFDAKGTKVDSKSTKSTLKPNKKSRVEVSFELKNPTRWDIKNPHLYSVTTEILQHGKVIDTYHSKFGVRTIKFTADDGFYLNGRRVQLYGVNLHHDLGPIGGAFNKRAMQRQLEIMKEMGVNAIRNSHNTAAPEMIDLCDEMGLLFFNEVFDKYDAKMDITENTDFEEFAHRNVKNFVVRDRNHPSIFLWSVGNEIWDVSYNKGNGFYRLHTMLNYVKKYQPSAYTTLVCDAVESAELRHFDLYDVHNWNYSRRYKRARELAPEKSVVISESASTVSTRGFYEFPLAKTKTDFTKSMQISSYDLNAPSWAEIPDDDFMWQQEDTYVAGEFIWTGFDYLGEPTPYHNTWTKQNNLPDKMASRSSYFGAVDLVGIPKDRFYLYRSYWKPEATTIHMLPHWNWDDRVGKNVPVYVYTNGDCAELFINGKSQGKKCKKPNSKNSKERFRLMWNDVVYQKGQIKTVAYKNGKRIGEKVIKTAGKPYRLKLTPDRKIITADGEDLSFVLVEAYDKNGNLAPLANNNVQFSISGTGTIKAVGNGNPQSFHSFKSHNVNLFYGKAMLIIQSNENAGNIKISATSKGLRKARTQLISKKK